MPKLISTKFFKPYSSKLQTLQSTGKGVYIIKKGDKFVYVGMSATDVKKTMYRHFQKWTDLRSSYTKKLQAYERVTYHEENKENFTCKVIYTSTDKEAHNLERLLINKLKPKDNTLKLELFSSYEEMVINEKLKDIQYISASQEKDYF